ncbi:MAG: cold shock domain-containing protein [Paracoccaceae bacterium]|nr:cold shock domain-containing protein [Paracoccaceae bacterium]
MVMLKGHVKWFDTSKGYGFLVVEDGSGDILLHANVLRNFGRGSVAEGTSVDFEVQETERGRQVSRIIDIEVPKDDGLDADGSEFWVPTVDGVEMVPARVKWFDRSKGFGFANSFKSELDIFLHMEVLRYSGFSDLQSGEAIVIQIVDGPRGKMAGAIHPWDEPKILEENS